MSGIKYEPRAVKKKTPCRHCGHDKADHTISSGPNSIGMYFHDLCGIGGTNFPGYGFISRCRCEGFERRRFWHKKGGHPC